MKLAGTLLIIWGYIAMVSWVGMIPYALTHGTGYLDTWSYFAGVVATPILMVYFGKKLRKRAKANGGKV